ncbi:hypothetical protein AB3S75_010385 [Citrus x aurantiifolia]
MEEGSSIVPLQNKRNVSLVMKMNSNMHQRSRMCACFPQVGCLAQIIIVG